MQIDAPNREATLSVGEFASFTPYPSPSFGGAAGIWRAQLGTQWHQRIQAESQTAGDGMENEVPIAGALHWRSWTLHLSGRIDQLKREPDHVHLREIKTVQQRLPITYKTLLQRYPSYPVQLLAYRELLLNEELRTKSEEPKKGASLNSPFAMPRRFASRMSLRSEHHSQFHLELLFVEVATGLTQSISLDTDYDALLAEQLDTLVDHLEAKQERLARLRTLSVRSAYPSPRPGQETIQQDLAAAASQAPFVFLEAPTGYGKTGVAWEHAARRLAAGQVDRILYLTSKTTGQTEAVSRLRRLLSEERRTKSEELENTMASPALNSSLLTLNSSPTASFWHIRNKQEHCIHTEFRCSPQTCPYLTDLHEKWKRSGLQRLYSLSHDEISIDVLKSEGRAAGICPYEIMRAGLSHRDIWIGDYNYLFSPHSARLLAEQSDFDPGRTFLIIDEAHNLPSRVASAFTYEISVHQVYASVDDLSEARASRRIQNLLKGLAHVITHLPVAKRRGRSDETAIPIHFQEDFDDHLAMIAETLGDELLPYEDLSPETNELLFQLAAARSSQRRGELQHLLWSSEKGVARLECIDASRLIASQLSQYNGALFLSATLSPFESYLEEIGLSEELRVKSEKPEKKKPAPPSILNSSLLTLHLTPSAPWRENAYDVAIDLRVDTRLKTRQAHLQTTAATIAAAGQSFAPAIIFFPSYAYAQSALEQLQFHHPIVRAILQPRAGGTLAERTAFLEEALAFHDALFLILGSSYAEGVDTLGGKASCTIVVSPALPEMNLIQEAKRQRHDQLGRNGFERAYLQPGIQKVNQALGRLVRAPGHRVKALLHCQRFADPKTKRLLDPLYRSKTYIHSDEDLQNWLQQPLP